jgi:hypothetical protein
MAFPDLRGVLEYFSRSAILTMLQAIKPRGPVRLMLIEPLDGDHDLQRNMQSRPYGMELSFSHNYPHLLAEAGFHILSSKESMSRGVRWLAQSAAD